MTLRELLIAILNTRASNGKEVNLDSTIEIEGYEDWWNVQSLSVKANGSVRLEADCVLVEKVD